MATKTLKAGEVSRVGLALGSTNAGKVVSGMLNTAGTLQSQTTHTIAGFIVATSTSQTTNFGSLVVGDKVLHISVAGSTNDTVTVATAGTLGEAAIVNDIYVVFRAFTAPADPSPNY